MIITFVLLGGAFAGIAVIAVLLHLMHSLLQRRQFTLVAAFFQIVFIVFYAVFCDYNDHELPTTSLGVGRVFVNTDYPLFQDIHVMIFVGFGFLMAFLKRYGFSAISVNLLLSAFVIQWAMLLRGFLSRQFQETGKFYLGVNEMVNADMSCVSVLITMGVLLGRLTPVQFVVLAFLETSFSVCLEHVLFNILHINDGGRSLVVHTFGAYFGLAAGMVGHKRNVMEMDAEGSIHHSDLFSMIGTLFLWIFFPSFNAAVQEPADARHRAIINSYIAMASGTVTTFFLSSLADHLGRFNMIHIQSSTLAGGVAVGSCANAILYPYHAAIVGVIGAAVSVIGHVTISPRLERRFRLYDTCGVHNLHGLPGLLSGICSIIFALGYDPAGYGDSLYHIYPYFSGGPFQGDRDSYSQALFQLAGLGIALGVGIVGGLITGLFLRLPLWNQVDDPQMSHGDINYYAQTDFSFLSKYNAAREQVELAQMESDPLNREVY